MHARLFGNRTCPGKLLSLLLVFLLLFAALHVSQHDLVEGSGGPLSHSDCQISHVPGVQLCVPPTPVPLLVLIFILAFATTATYTKSVMRHRRIRAPPLPS